MKMNFNIPQSIDTSLLCVHCELSQDEYLQFSRSNSVPTQWRLVKNIFPVPGPY